MKAALMNELVIAAVDALKELKVYLQHQRETYDAQLKVLDEEKKMLEKMMAPPVQAQHDNLKPIDFKALFGSGDGK